MFRVYAFTDTNTDMMIKPKTNKQLIYLSPFKWTESQLKKLQKHALDCKCVMISGFDGSEWIHTSRCDLV